MHSTARKACLAHLSALLLASTSAISALADNDQAYCAPDQQHAPDGIGLRMADRYFWTCGSWTDGNWRQFILRVDPDAFPSLNHDRSAFSLRVVENVEGVDRIANYKRYLTEVSSYTFAGVEYASFGSTVKGPNGRSRRILFIYEPDSNSGLPEHRVNCSGWGDIGFDDYLRCTVAVDVGPAFGSILFLGAFRPDLSFTEDFPSVAQDIATILERADITDEALSGELSIDVID